MSPGAYAFLVLFCNCFGGKAIHIISRTTAGSWWSHHTKLGTVEAWVVRFLKQCGVTFCDVPEDNIHICCDRTGWHGKGPIADMAQQTHSVDNDMDCLWSVMFDPCGNAAESIIDNDGCCIRFTAHDTRVQRTGWPPSHRRYLVTLSSWYDVAKYFELPYIDELWDVLSQQGPPHAEPHNAEPTWLVMDLLDELKGQSGSPKTGSPRPLCGASPQAFSPPSTSVSAAEKKKM